MTTAHTLYFAAPYQVEIREQPLPALGANDVLVETVCSAISPGSEMLVYRGECLQNLPDEHDALSSNIQYPVAYGYACVGRVTEIGKSVNREWENRLVFAFQPHTTHFVAQPAALYPVPASFSPEIASLFPNMETAVNLVQDAAPLLGERVLVLGQGVIGLLTTALLAQFPLETLVTVDRHELRRQVSATLGVTATLNPDAPDFADRARSLLTPGADLTLELSGSSAALNHAIALTRFSGRVVIGSWYGTKPAALDLGGAFHRSRLRLISSQVSSIAPELSARWDKARRFEAAWKALGRLQADKWITHRFPLEKASDAYRLLDERPQETIQIVFSYLNGEIK